MRDLAEQRIALSERKNANYAGNDENAFQNFDMVEVLTNGRITREQGLFVRIVDKVARLGNLITGVEDQVGESLRDTTVDLANYADILTACLDEKHTLTPEQQATVDAAMNATHPTTAQNPCRQCLNPLEKGVCTCGRGFAGVVPEPSNIDKLKALLTQALGAKGE